MIEIINAYTRSRNEWCTCCQKQTNTKRIKFLHNGRQGISVVLCDDCRRELARTIQAIPLDKVKQARAEIEDKIYNYPDRNISEYEDCLAILNKLIESEE